MKKSNETELERFCKVLVIMIMGAVSLVVFGLAYLTGFIATLLRNLLIQMQKEVKRNNNNYDVYGLSDSCRKALDRMYSN